MMEIARNSAAALSSLSLLAGAVLPNSGCSRRDSEGSQTSSISGAQNFDTTRADFEDPIDIGHALAQETDPACAFLLSEKYMSEETVNRLHNFYLNAIAEHFGHDPELSQQIGTLKAAGRIAIFATEDIAAMAETLSGKRPDLGGHNVGLTIGASLQGEETPLVVILLSLEAFETQARATMVLGHELEHVQSILELGMERYADLPRAQIEFDAYDQNISRLERIRETWLKRYGENSKDLQELDEAIADHKYQRALAKREIP